MTAEASEPSAWEEALAGPLRTNAAYRLRPIDSLSAHDRALLRGWGVDASTGFGVLVAPSEAGLPAKLVDPTAAELLAGLTQPRSVPALTRDRLAGLVLDGVLEVEGPTGFVTGPAAYDALCSGTRPTIGPGRLGRLAEDGLEYAARLRLTNVELLTARLYGYNRVPLAQRWTRSYPAAGAVLDVLPKSVLSRYWDDRTPAGHSHWLSWSLRRRGVRAPASGHPYKLYVSPRIEDLPEVVTSVIDVLTELAAPQFKIGADAAGLLRPDKLVVYLEDSESTAAVAGGLAEALAGVAPHGVPFTAELARDGLVSWGGDPRRDAGPVGRRAESWRSSVCRRLAEGLVAAHRAQVTRTDPVDFALTRLCADGVDVRTFAPAGLASPKVPA